MKKLYFLVFFKTLASAVWNEYNGMKIVIGSTEAKLLKMRFFPEKYIYE